MVNFYVAHFSSQLGRGIGSPRFPKLILTFSQYTSVQKVYKNKIFCILLKQDLEDFALSSGVDGFILFSMGSIIKASDMQEEKRKTLLSAFANLTQKVLWKWETEEMADLPKNVKLSKWLPQQDVLGHSKIR